MSNNKLLTEEQLEMVTGGVLGSSYPDEEHNYLGKYVFPLKAGEGGGTAGWYSSYNEAIESTEKIAKEYAKQYRVVVTVQVFEYDPSTCNTVLIYEGEVAESQLRA